jgi:hypothetical protein
VFKNEEQIDSLGEGFPPASNTPPGYDYVPLNPNDPDLTAHKRVAATQVIKGMQNLKKVSGNRTLRMLPKHLDPPQSWELGATAWGIHAIQDWSLWRVMAWLGALTAIGMGFVVFWLVYVNSTDLQNAFVPVTFFITMAMFALATPQVMGIA